MKKIFCALVLFCLIFNFVNAESNLEAEFVKGNIHDKIVCVKKASSSESAKISTIALDFVINNISLLADDRDLAGLAIASILAYSVDEYKSDASSIILKFGSVFYNFQDRNVKIAILEKICSLAQDSKDKESIEFINTFLRASFEDKQNPSDVEKKAISVLAQIGNEKSFEILYTILKDGSWNLVKDDIKKALIVLAEKSSNIIITIAKNADFAELQQIHTIFLENLQISSTFKSELAENLLTNSMILVRDASKVSKEISDFQLNICKILYDNKWTRSSALILSYFEVAKSEFNANFLSEADFSNVIKYVEKLASKDSVKIFISYLEDLNGKMNQGYLPSVNVVSALIQALGALGDKSAFDCLLYTTYLNYPEQIVTQARNALSSLKW